MTTTATFENLLLHSSHRIRIVTGAAGKGARSVDIECLSCNKVLLHVPEKKVEQRANQAEILAYVDGGILHQVYSTIPLNVIRADFDEDAEEGCLVAQFPSRQIVDFKLPESEYIPFRKNIVKRFGRKEFNRLNKLVDGLKEATQRSRP